MSMFKSSRNKQSLAQQLKNKLSFSTPLPKDVALGGGGHGSGLRMPQIPIPAEESLMKQSLREKLTSTTNQYVDCYGGFFTEHSIMAEFNTLKKTRLPGVYVIPSSADPHVWYGVVFIRQGTYQDGVFRFSLMIPHNYPDGDCPSVTFTPPVFHPFIDPTSGLLDTTRGFTTWKPNFNHIWQVLLYMRRIFYKFDARNAVNKQAGELYDSDIAAFKRKVKEHMNEISNTLYEDLDVDDPHCFRFREYQPDIHDGCRDLFTTKYGNTDEEDDELHVGATALTDGGQGDAAHEDDLLFARTKLSGLSFLEPGTSAIFTKEN